MTKKSGSSQGKLLGDIFFNILIPTLILNKASRHFGENGPLIALILALIFPIAYGLYDYHTSHKKNVFTFIGLINILFTGGLALLSLEGFWFAVKEAAFPLVIGLGVMLSAFSKKPFIRMLLYQDQIMNVEKIEATLKGPEKESQMQQLLKTTTLMFAGSFLLSAILNFLLAQHIFTEIPLDLAASERSAILNDQIAQMNWKGYLVIAVPMLVITFGILLFLLRGIKKLTGLDLQDVVAGAEDIQEAETKS